MKKAFRILRYDWPLHIVLWVTNWLPDNVIFLRLRGMLASPFFAQCGRQLRLGRNVTFYNPSNIYIGNWVYVAYGCWFSAGKKLMIEDQVMFGPYNIIATTNHTMLNGSYRFGLPVGSPVSIGEGSWVGGHCVILQGVHVGKGCLVAASSVVTKSVSDFKVIAGNPAKVIRDVNIRERE